MTTGVLPLQGEAMPGECHPLSPVKAVGLDMLHARIQLKHLTLRLPGVVHQSIEPPVPVTVRSCLGVGNQLIEIEIVAITPIFRPAETGYRLDLAVVFQKGQGIAKQVLLAPNPADKLGFVQVRS